ncbi:hypothetical protein CRE_14109 [Caenorhabditis remanei]|uniref:DUF7869 domain-containing protein n=1 Tax=Caenorhabditis remanei TaxID=31234 RepID=E3MRK4_CAERE|nr:hypothetical protein CRE_14109 [Caenorhabditis remanei]
MDSFADPSLSKYKRRPWYQKTVDIVSDAMKVMSEHVQFNSLNQVMVSPSISSQLNDTLVRCDSCFGLKEILERSHSDIERREAKRKLDQHYDYISRQRVIIQTLCAQSRDPNCDVRVVMIDGMSNRHTKLPRLVDRPKFVTDSIRVIMSLTTVQIARSEGKKIECATHNTFSGANSFTNFDYPSIEKTYSHDSSYTLSLFLNAISKLSTIPSVFVLLLDSAAMNKSYMLLGGLGVILSKISKLQKIYIVYPCKGHTHLSVDGHFGTLSQSLRSKNLLDPKDMTVFLEQSPSVAEVITTPTVYEFSEVQQHISKVGNLFSNAQFCLSKDETGDIYWSSAATLHSSLLFNAENDQNAFKLFKEAFLPEEFVPTIRKPETTIIENKVNELKRQCGELLTDQNHQNFCSYIVEYGKKSFRHTMTDINQKRQLVPSPATSPDDPHQTVLQFLKRNGYPTGKMPKNPSI